MCHLNDMVGEGGGGSWTLLEMTDYTNLKIQVFPDVFIFVNSFE